MATYERRHQMMKSQMTPEVVRRALAKTGQENLYIHFVQFHEEQNVLLAEDRDSGIARIEDDPAFDEERILTARKAMANEKTYSHEEAWEILGV